MPTLALPALAALAMAQPAQASVEAIERFHAEIEVNADGSLEVVEQIDIHALGREIRRGFIREFPTRYSDRLGNRVVVDFEMLGATRNGNPEPYWTERIENGIEIFLGDDSFLEVPRTHAYTLRYRTTRQLGYFDGYDELYWNVTGSGWIFPIDASSAVVRLPAAVPPESLSLACYTGYQDSIGRNCTFRVLEPGVVEFRTSRRLSPREGLTIAVGFPKGLVAQPTLADRIGFLLKDNAGVLIAVVGLLLLLIWYVLQWHRKGRDPDPGVVFPRYQPPDGHSPAGIRFLRRMGWDQRCFSADLVDAGVRGFLTIHRDKPTPEALLAAMPEKQRALVGKSKLVQRVIGMAMKATKELWRLERNPDGSPASLTTSQRAMVGKLFAVGPSLVLRNTDPKVVAAMQNARREQQQALSRQYKPKYFVGNGTVIGWGVVFSIAFLVIAFIASRQAGGAGLPLIAASAALTLAMHLLFAVLMKQPTDEGRRLLDEIEGLRMYLGLAEKTDLARLKGPGPTGEEPPLDAERYEQLLPYALALDVEDAWTKKFTLAAAAAGVAAAASGAHRWYRGNLAQVSNLGDMSKSLGTALSRQIASSSSPPGSRSGSSGGGRSGGGGGGGGGRGR